MNGVNWGGSIDTSTQMSVAVNFAGSPPYERSVQFDVEENANGEKVAQDLVATWTTEHPEDPIVMRVGSAAYFLATVNRVEANTKVLPSGGGGVEVAPGLFANRV